METLLQKVKPIMEKESGVNLLKLIHTQEFIKKVMS